MTEITYKKMSQALEDFLKLEAAGGIILVIAGALAIIMANSGFYGIYHGFLEMEAAVRVGKATLEKSMHHWINDGLMAVFFFLVGLEIKRELLAGELSSRERALLPVMAAIGGMIVPALLFWYFNKSHAENTSGWAIPAATDIAFALGVLALLGKRVPPAAKVLLMAVAVIDDLGAIVIIALFYTDGLSMQALYIACGLVACLVAMNRSGVLRPAAYVLVGFALWVAVLKSGIHATLAGVITALLIPYRKKVPTEPSNIARMEHTLHPWVSYLILPAFAFANAGVSLEGLSFSRFSEPLTLGIIAGLFLGKQLGVFGMLALTIKAGLSPMPAGLRMGHLYGLSMLCGIGFTMSLFIGALAFPSETMLDSVRIGVLAASALAAVSGYTLLRFLSSPQQETKTI